jgi:hypothetical protein
MIYEAFVAKVVAKVVGLWGFGYIGCIGYIGGCYGIGCGYYGGVAGFGVVGGGCGSVV